MISQMNDEIKDRLMLGGTPPYQIEHLTRKQEMEEGTSGFCAFSCQTNQPAQPCNLGNRKTGSI